MIVQRLSFILVNFREIGGKKYTQQTLASNKDILQNNIIF